MKTVNPIFLNTLLAPFVGGADDDSFDSIFDECDDREILEIVIEPILKAHAVQCGPIKERIKEAFGYYLSLPEYDFSRVLDSCILPFDIDNKRVFFLRLWQALYHCELPDVVSMQGGYSEKIIIDEPIRLAAESRKQMG